MLGLKGALTQFKIYRTFNYASNVRKRVVSTNIKKSLIYEDRLLQYDCIGFATALEIRKTRNRLENVQILLFSKNREDSSIAFR